MKATILSAIAALTIALIAAGWFVNQRIGQSTGPAHNYKKVACIVKNEKLKDGDIIFQTSRSSQSQAIQTATHSPYSHCGIIYKEKDSLYVFEAVQPVKSTPLAKWILRGENEHFVVKRLKNSSHVLTPSVLLKMKREGLKMAGKNYDTYFGWSDDKVYCSELIWKIYKRSTGLEVGKLQQLRDFDLNNDVVMVKMKERYGNQVPAGETVISPASIFNSPLLETVVQM